MMDHYDINCPYCDHGQNIDREDCYDEDLYYEKLCDKCDKNFTYTVSISYFYNAKKADCLNGSEHKFEQTHTYPIKNTRMRCADCSIERPPTNLEMEKIIQKHQQVVNKTRSIEEQL